MRRRGRADTPAIFLFPSRFASGCGFREDAEKEQVAYRNIDPIRFMRDPFSDKLEDAGWCVTYNYYHKSIFENKHANNLQNNDHILCQYNSKKDDLDPLI